MMVAARDVHVESDMEIEELHSDAAPTAAAEAGHSHRMAPFALGLILLVLAVALIPIGFGETYYQVEYRNGQQPAGDTDQSDTQTVEMRLNDWRATTTGADGGTSGDTEGYDDAPVPGILAARLLYTAAAGLVFLGLALLLGFLHRLGALTLPGPAPVLAVFGCVFLLIGTLLFMMDAAHHARLAWVPGTLERPLSFFTFEPVDGTQVHDVTARPGPAFWLHAGATVLAPVGTALMFWPQWRHLALSLRRFAESAPVE